MNAADTRDVVVAGGGLAGALAALALVRLGLRVTMVEAAAPGSSKPDGRSLALSLASCRVFESLGLWPRLTGVAEPISTVHVSEAGCFGATHLRAKEQQVAALGYVIPAADLLTAIETAAVAAGVERLRPAEVLAAPLSGEGLRFVEVRSAGAASAIPARLLVIADGAASKLREQLHIASRVRRFNEVALVTTVDASHPQPGVAYERFTSEGVLALLPRAGHRKGVVWTLSESRAKAYAVLPEREFASRVDAAIGGRLGRLKLCAPIQRYPLVASHAVRQTARRAILVGNAAHALHPVAAQGFNLTVRDIAAFAECVADARKDAGAPDVLARYARLRRADQARTRAFTGTLRRAGGWPTPLASPVRASGFLVTELVRPLARGCARIGMGLAQRPLPALVRRAPL